MSNQILFNVRQETIVEFFAEENKWYQIETNYYPTFENHWEKNGTVIKGEGVKVQQSLNKDLLTIINNRAGLGQSGTYGTGNSGTSRENPRYNLENYIRIKEVEPLYQEFSGFMKYYKGEPVDRLMREGDGTLAAARANNVDVREVKVLVYDNT